MIIVLIRFVTGIIGSRLLLPEPNAGLLEQGFAAFSKRLTTKKSTLESIR
jgi:hypothetical protein